MLSFEGASVFRIQALYGVLIRDIPFLPAQEKGRVGRGALGLTVVGFYLPCTPGKIVLISTSMFHAMEIGQEEAEGAGGLSLGQLSCSPGTARQEFTVRFSQAQLGKNNAASD